jgi:uncharacterized surface protein with fasciclin (FAS1) repeats
MKKRFLKPIAAVAVAGLTVFGCASTSDTRDATAYGTPQNTTVTEGTDDRTADYDREPVRDTEMGGTTTTTQTETEVNQTYDQGTATDRMANTGMAGRDTDMFDNIDNTQQYSVMDLARMDENFSTFIQLVDQAGLTQALEQMEGPITVFLPTNEAFDQLPKERYDYLTNTENSAELVRILQAHVMATEISGHQFTGRQVIESSQGNQISVFTEGTAAGAQTITIGGAEVIRTDIEASNGVIHVVNGIVMPEDARGNTIMDR